MLRRRKKSDAPEAARQQVREARRADAKTRARDKKVQASSNEILAVVREINELQRRNNFVHAIRHALGGGGG